MELNHPTPGPSRSSGRSSSSPRFKTLTSRGTQTDPPIVRPQALLPILRNRPIPNVPQEPPRVLRPSLYLPPPWPRQEPVQPQPVEPPRPQEPPMPRVRTLRLIVIPRPYYPERAHQPAFELANPPEGNHQEPAGWIYNIDLSLPPPDGIVICCPELTCPVHPPNHQRG